MAPLNPLLAGLKPVHPGEILREDVLPATGLPKSKIAAMLGISRQVLYDLLGERQGVTPAMALKLGRLFGNRPEFWASLQLRYELAMTEETMADELAAIEPLKVA